jgi:hypothetical protein
MSRDVEKTAQGIVSTSVQDAMSGAYGYSVPAMQRAIQLEQQRDTPRVALIRGLQTQIRKKERAARLAPKAVA